MHKELTILLLSISCHFAVAMNQSDIQEGIPTYFPSNSQVTQPAGTIRRVDQTCAHCSAKISFDEHMFWLACGHAIHQNCAGHYKNSCTHCGSNSMQPEYHAPIVGANPFGQNFVSRPELPTVTDPASQNHCSTCRSIGNCCNNKCRALGNCIGEACSGIGTCCNESCNGAGDCCNKTYTGISDCFKKTCCCCKKPINATPNSTGSTSTTTKNNTAATNAETQNKPFESIGKISAGIGTACKDLGSMIRCLALCSCTQFANFMDCCRLTEQGCDNNNSYNDPDDCSKPALITRYCKKKNKESSCYDLWNESTRCCTEACCTEQERDIACANVCFCLTCLGRCPCLGCYLWARECRDEYYDRHATLRMLKLPACYDNYFTTTRPKRGRGFLGGFKPDEEICSAIDLYDNDPKYCCCLNKSKAE